MNLRNPWTSLVGLLLLLLVSNDARQIAGAARHSARSRLSIAADINGDGLSDNVSAGGTRIQLHLSRGPDLSFGEVHSSIVGVAVADVDRDGDGDVVALSSRGNLHLWRNDGAGRFSHGKTRPWTADAQFSESDVERKLVMAEPFSGFPRDCHTLFKQLAKNNNRDWFLAHKEDYERLCRAPLQSLLAELEPRFGKAKLSRINRDMRFAVDGAPYKTYIGAGLGGRYIALSADGLYVGAGIYKPEPSVLQRFRAAIDDETTGRELQAIVKSLRRKGYEVASHETLSSAPRGYARDHPRLELLQMKDIHAGRMFAPSAWLSTKSARQRIERVMNDTGVLVTWLKKHVSGGRGEERSSKTRVRPARRAR